MPYADNEIDRTLKTAKHAVKKLIATMYGGSYQSAGWKRDMLRRELCCTPYHGNYGTAGWIFAINGSPPRGMIVTVEADGDALTYPPAIFYIEQNKSRRLGVAQADVVRVLVGYMRKYARPKIVCLCGSTRFMDAFHEQNRILTEQGKIVLTVGLVGTSSITERSETLTPEVKLALDQLRLRKIDLADEILVLNVGGYVGESTKREIEYARHTGKPIAFLESPEPKGGA